MDNNHLGQRYAGQYVLSPAAGKPSPIPVGIAGEVKLKPGQSEGVDLKGLMERLQQFLYRFRVRAKDFFKVFGKKWGLFKLKF